MRKSQIILFLLALLIWSFLTWPPDFQHLLVGVLVSGFVAFMTGDMFAPLETKGTQKKDMTSLTGFVKRPPAFRRLSRYFWFLYYIPLFIWECIKANIDVAYRVIHPDLPINPGIVKVKTTLKSDTGLTFLANSITLTPGTMSVDIDPEGGYLYIHWIDVKSMDTQKASEIIVKTFEEILRRIFD